MTTRADRLRAAIEAYGEATAMVRYIDASSERMREEYRCVAADMMTQAVAILAEAEVDGDRLQTIADEAFGPFATEPTDALLTLVERGIFEQRKALAEAEKEIEFLRGRGILVIGEPLRFDSRGGFGNED